MPARKALPLAAGFGDGGTDSDGARFVTGDTDRCVHEAFAHMGLLAEVERRQLNHSFRGWRPAAKRRPPAPAAAPEKRAEPRVIEPPPTISEKDLPF